MAIDETFKLLSDFTRYQVKYITNHENIRLEPIVESLVVQALVDAKICYLLEIKESENYEET